MGRLFPLGRLGREATVLFSAMKPAYRVGEKPGQKGKAIPLWPRDHLGYSEISLGILAPEVLGVMHLSASSPVGASASERESWLGDWRLQGTSFVRVSPELVPKEKLLLHSQLLWSMGTRETEYWGLRDVTLTTHPSRCRGWGGEGEACVSSEKGRMLELS